MTYDYMIVGAGFYGSIMANELTKRNKRVLVIDKRNHIGGNCYTEVRDGIICHQYGPHVFHTNDRNIWYYLQALSDWRPFHHTVKVKYREQYYSFPPNLLTTQQLDNMKVEVLFRGYSEKQWGMPYGSIPSSIINRIPVRDNFNDSYFDDEYVALPKYGYTPLIERLLDKSEVLTNTEYAHTDEDYKKLVWSGPIDEYFGESGLLGYRSLRFDDTLYHTPDKQGCAVINYADRDIPYTRTIEHKWFHPTDVDHTIVTKEFPMDKGEPYYPIPTLRNLTNYKALKKAAKVHKDVIFGGRLGTYKYMDMDEVIAQALADSRKELS